VLESGRDFDDKSSPPRDDEGVILRPLLDLSKVGDGFLDAVSPCDGDTALLCLVTGVTERGLILNDLPLR